MKLQAAIGNVNIDVIVWVDEIPPPDGSVKANRILHTMGGGAVNYSVAVARMGHQVLLHGAVADVFNRLGFRRWLEEQGVNTSLLVEMEGDPGTTVVLNVGGQPRRIISYRGVNSLLHPKHVAQAFSSLEREPHLVHLASTRLDITNAFLETRERLGWRSLASLDPGSETPSLAQHLAELLEQIDILLMNREEYSMAFNSPPGELVQTHPHLILVLKEGRRGATVYWKEGRAHATPPPVKAVDTTGSGDAFNAAFNTCMLERMEPRECVRMGVAAGSLKAMREGSTSSPLRDEVEEFAQRVALGP